ncbi:hypothetical protein RKD55_004672 [Rossellomorea marisflavi]
MRKDCLTCGNSMSTDENELFCNIKEEFVKEDDSCEDYN